jgi:Putative phage abortive infection protein
MRLKGKMKTQSTLNSIPHDARDATMAAHNSKSPKDSWCRRSWDWLTKNGSWLFIGVIVLTLFIAYPLILNGLASWVPVQPLFKTMKRGGAIGDSFGALTSFLTACSVIYLARSFWLTQRSAEHAAASQQKQQFVLQFFEWQKYSHAIVENFSIPKILGGMNENAGGSIRLAGRDALHHMWELLVSDQESQLRTMIHTNLGPDFYNRIMTQPNATSSIFVLVKTFIANPSMPRESLPLLESTGVTTAVDIYLKAYQRYEYQFDYWYRNLYRLIAWVDTQSCLSNSEKWEYVRITRAHLSWTEMAWVFFNALTPNGEKFKVLIEKYALFDNLAMSEASRNSHTLLFCRSKFAARAFSSAEAKTLLGIPKDF